ncbi:hypothetical protein KKA14_13770, partial [bacterium]|nr:hypothetical protein [bacterium]
QFLEGFLNESYPDPSLLMEYLQRGGWIISQFNMSYLMYLICQSCIKKEYELNRLIAKCVAYLTTLNTPRQNTQLLQQKKIEDDLAVSKELIKLYEKYADDEAKKVRERASNSSPQGNVENLLAEFGL